MPDLFWGKKILWGKSRVLSLKWEKSGHTNATLRLTASDLSECVVDSLRGRTEQLIYTVDCEQSFF